MSFTWLSSLLSMWIFFLVLLYLRMQTNQQYRLKLLKTVIWQYELFTVVAVFPTQAYTGCYAWYEGLASL